MKSRFSRMLADEDLYAKSPKVDFDFRGFIS